MTLTRKEAATILGVSYNGVRKMEARGALSGRYEVREGVSTVVFTVNDVQKLLERRTGR